ncbi:maltose permease [Fomitopsis serialis]|uniref:maltose permease n=1 Tax=Fomitopsis serialis TaxID=139415 RepID=UPI0020078FE5|nr:maltose permease [Neoantrodia serialis]KAH9917803.1 maltose permease [Neoantrodia serialis]
MAHPEKDDHEPEKVNHGPEHVEDAASIDKGKPPPYSNLTALAHAAASEKAYTPLQAVRVYWQATLWCLFMCMGALLWGYDSQVGGGLLSVPSFRRDFGFYSGGAGEYILAAQWQSAFNSVSSIGGMFGGLSLGYVSDKLGRRGAMGVCCIVSIVGIFIQFFTYPHKNAQLIVGKLVNGYALGMYVSGASSYCAEVSPLALRGITTSSVNLWIVLGQLMSNGVIEGTGSWTSSYAYRLPFALQWIFPVILLIGLPFAPESPWWLVRKGRKDDARGILVRLSDGSSDVDLQLRQIQDTIALEDSFAANSTYADCFRGVNGRRTMIACMVFVLQQAAGVVFVLGYSTYFFELAGFQNNNAFRLGVGVTGIGVAGNLINFYTVNKVGRRLMFNWTMFASTIVLFLVGFLAIPSNNQSAKWAMASFTIIYNFIFQLGLGPLGYVIFAEVSSAKLRSKTVGIGILVNSLCGMVMNIVIPYLVTPDEANLGGKVGFIFGGLCAIGTAWGYFYIPETKNRTVDELDTMFERKVAPRKFGTYVIEEEDLPVPAQEIASS